MFLSKFNLLLIHTSQKNKVFINDTFFILFIENKHNKTHPFACFVVFLRFLEVTLQLWPTQKTENQRFPLFSSVSQFSM